MQQSLYKPDSKKNNNPHLLESFHSYVSVSV